MFLHWRANLADQNKQQPLKINIRVTYHTVLSVWNKPLIDTCQHCSTSRANQALRSLANAGFQNRGVCLQAFPSFPSPSPHFHFLALVSFLVRPKPRIPFLGLSLLRNQTETLATQASTDWSRHVKNLLQPIRSTTQIRVVSRHQYGILLSFVRRHFAEKQWWRREMSAVFSGYEFWNLPCYSIRENPKVHVQTIFELFWKNSSYVSDVSVCIFVAL